MTKQLPPGQFETEKWPILHEGDVYQFDESTWEFRLFGDVKEEVSLSYRQVMELPKTISTIDMHCVTTWSKFDTTFEGIAFREFLRFVELEPDVKYVKIYGYLNGDRFGYSANLPLEALMGDDALFVYRWKDKHHDWQDISPKHGYPLRFIPPASFYLWKGAKWASGIRFMKKDEPGYWEQRGYSMTANPFKEERFANPAGTFKLW
ncbi:sulfite oxidase-like oxidoreductase [Saccharococcus caldoxylosilyticus]|jgi:DMSO/TMAO reductase YedYZ molybdopterin-dependent catalytic subunit|uniref:sulfite oxidase-like oxidoreductase n=2 Tax=Saccharococcus caldoxylosilyticus TaxID=81408 RepID=UPI001C4DF1A9|nr:sulfite oxidase-like oxidoreductase [Parageobacillus caldoxylosilyticus]QXJ40380.1 TMAO/DMSO reductase [Parageobacillus caldoxylosilyticus]BDG43513.1 oxidoreductase [Parageobacillus caldoxylosilyticus]